MLPTKQNFKTAIIGTTTLSLLAIVAPAIAQTSNLRANIRLVDINPSTLYQPQFNISPVSPYDPTETPVEFINGIRGFNLFRPPLTTPVPNSFRSKLDLTGIRYRDFTFQLPENIFYSFSNSNFSSFSGPFYEYSFLLNPPVARINEFISFYVPSKFIYYDALSQQSFSVDLSINSDNKFLRTSLANGLGLILKNAKSIGINTVFFPSYLTTVQSSLLSNSNTLTNDADVSKRGNVIFETTPIPESNLTAGIMILGIIGSLAIFRQQGSKYKT